MDIQGALAGISVYNSMTAYPLICLKGLAIYLQSEKTGEQTERMKEYLKSFRDQFAKVVLEYGSNANEAMLKNISVYEGIYTLAKTDSQFLEKIVSNLGQLVELIEQILNGKSPRKEEVERFVPFLMGFIEKSENSLSRSRYENYLLGHPAVGY